MTAQETKLLNAFETTLTGTIGASDTTLTVNSVTDSASNTLTASCYLIINPDSATNREVILVTGVNSGTKTLDVGSVGNRYLTGSAASSGLSHASGSVVRMSPVQQHIEDLNDRVDTIINEAGTELKTTLFLDEDNMASNSATKGVTQQSVKAYVDTQLTAEDLDISADSGSNIAIDLDSETLDLEGGTGIDTATGTNKVTFAIDSTVATLTGSQALTNKTIDVDSNTVSNIEVDNLKSGVLDTDLSSTAGTDTTLASAKAIKTYVDAQVTAQDLDLISDSGTIDIDLDGDSLTVTGGEGIDTSATGTTLTIAGEDATTSNKGVASFSSDNFAVSSGAVTIKSGGVDLAAEVTGTLPVANGGTGATSLTDGGVLLGSGTGAITATGVLANGQLLIGDGTSDPTVATLTEGSNITITEGAGSITIASTDTNTTYSAGDGLDLSGTTFSTDLKSNGGLVIESTELAVDLGASSITGTLDETDGGTGLTSYTTGDVIYASSSNTLAKLAIGSSGQVLKVSSGGIVEWAADTSNSYTAGDGLDLSGGNEFSVDLKSNGGLVIESTELAIDLSASSITGTLDTADGGTGLTSFTAGDIVYFASGTTFTKLGIGSAGQALKVNSGGNAPEWGSVGSATALIDGDSDFTLADGIASGIHYELDNTDMADWNQGGIALKAAGGIFRHNQTQTASYTVASGEGAVLAGPIEIQGTLINAGTMVIL